MIAKTKTAIVLLLLLGTWFVLQNISSVRAIPIKQALASFPTTLGQYTMVHASKSTPGVRKMLGVDDEINFTYRAPTGQVINLYVGYYSAVGVTGGYHSPRNCLPGGGWGIDQITPYTLDTGIEGNTQSVISEMLIRNGNQYQVVLYWYQNRGRIIASEYWEKIYLVLDSLGMQRRDGTFVRIMKTVAEDDIGTASTEAAAFAEQVMSALESHLPGRSL